MSQTRLCEGCHKLRRNLVFFSASQFVTSLTQSRAHGRLSAWTKATVAAAKAAAKDKRSRRRKMRRPRQRRRRRPKGASQFVTSFTHFALAASASSAEVCVPTHGTDEARVTTSVDRAAEKCRVVPATTIVSEPPCSVRPSPARMSAQPLTLKPLKP